MTLRQDATHLHYRATFPGAVAADDTAALLHDYFNLAVPLAALYTTWAARDPVFAATTLTRFHGIRILRQDPWENLVSFICSSNNHISRISGMVQNLCKGWGRAIPAEDGGDVYYDFPEPAVLAAVVGLEARLRELGFGYRAGYIAKAAKMVVDDHEEGWLEGLRKLPYKEAKEALITLPGVGPKVADCVCLMSLDKMEAVPVDTHGREFPSIS